MKPRFILLIFIPLLLCCSSCIELIEDTTIHDDGTGTYKIILNLSSSTVRINSIMALDSIDGHKVPTRSELQEKFNHYLRLLDDNNGISNVSGKLDTEHWIAKIQLDFASLQQLKSGFVALGKTLNKGQTSENIHQANISFKNQTYSRYFSVLISSKWKEKIKKDKDYDKLNKGKFVFIQRFDSPILSTSSDNIRISKNKKAVMLQLLPVTILRHPEKLDYSIKIKP